MECRLLREFLVRTVAGVAFLLLHAALGHGAVMALLARHAFLPMLLIQKCRRGPRLVVGLHFRELLRRGLDCLARFAADDPQIALAVDLVAEAALGRRAKLGVMGPVHSRGIALCRLVREFGVAGHASLALAEGRRLPRRNGV